MLPQAQGAWPTQEDLLRRAIQERGNLTPHAFDTRLERVQDISGTISITGMRSVLQFSRQILHAACTVNANGTGQRVRRALDGTQVLPVEELLESRDEPGRLVEKCPRQVA